jgi:hypothetical protein
MEIDDEEWNSGETASVTLIDNDQNKNSLSDEDFSVKTNSTKLIPTLITGNPFTLGEKTDSETETYRVSFLDYTSGPTFTERGTPDLGLYIIGGDGGTNSTSTYTVQKFAKRALSTPAADTSIDAIFIDTEQTAADFRATFRDTTPEASSRLHG